MLLQGIWKVIWEKNYALKKDLNRKKYQIKLYFHCRANDFLTDKELYKQLSIIIIYEQNYKCLFLLLKYMILAKFEFLSNLLE